MKQISFRQISKVALFGAALTAAGLALAEPSMHEIYETASSGNLGRAESMIQEVLTAHPESAKAHYVHAELLSKEGRINDARTELTKAEQLQPNLPFAKPAAVSELKHQLYKTSGSSAQHASGSSSFLMWGGIALVVLMLVLFLRALFNRPQMQSSYNMGGNPAVPGGGFGPQGPYPQGGYGPGYGGMGGGGMGSGIMGGLATGAAVGAGIVAGEVLMHNILDDHPNRQNDNYTPPETYSNSNGNMGGNDFGIADNGSWDSGSSLGDNSSFGGDDSDWS